MWSRRAAPVNPPARATAWNDLSCVSRIACPPGGSIAFLNGSLQIKQFAQWSAREQSPRNGRQEPPFRGGRLPFRYHNPVAIRGGPGALGELPAVLAGRRALLVTFPEARGLGLVERVRGILGPALAGVI